MLAKSITLCGFGRKAFIPTVGTDLPASMSINIPLQKQPFVNHLYYSYGDDIQITCNGNTTVMKKGAIYIIPYNLEYSLSRPSNGTGKLLYFNFMIFPPIVSEKLYEYIVPSFEAVYYTVLAIDSILNKHKVQDYTLSGVDRRALKLGGVPPEHGNANAEVIEDYFGVLYTLCSMELNIKTVSDKRILNVLEYIRSHFREDISINTLTEIACLNASHFNRLFKKSLDITPYQYIKELKITLAISLLNSENLSVSEIAEYVGYENTSSFSSAFKKITGLSPLQYISMKSDKKQ